MPARPTRYQEYLRSNHWQQFSDRMYKARKYECVHCGVKRGLHKHHVTYSSLGNERPWHVVYLCAKCHETLHKSLFAQYPIRVSAFFAAAGVFTEWLIDRLLIAMMVSVLLFMLFDTASLFF